MLRHCTIILLTLLVQACGSDVASELETPETMWWESSGDVTDAPGSASSDEDPMAAKYWAIYLSLEEGMAPSGSQGFVSVSEGLVQCEVVYVLQSAQAVSDCAACSRAWEFVRGEPTIVKDKEDACTTWGVSDMAGSILGFGHDYTSFYYRRDESWVNGGVFGGSDDYLEAQVYLD